MKMKMIDKPPIYEKMTVIINDPASNQIIVGNTLQLTAQLSPLNAIATLTWGSSNSSIASVNENTGLVTAHSTGTVTIYVTADGTNTDYDECHLTVVPQPANDIRRLVLSPSKLNLRAGQSETLSLQITPANATDQNVSWHIEQDGNVVMVNSTGTVFALAEGIARIYAKSPNGSVTSNTCTVVVSIETNVTSVSIRPTQITIAQNQVGTLSATVNPSSAANRIVSWTSSDPGIATVQGEFDSSTGVNTGTITPVSIGTTTITATSNNGKTATATVTVNPVNSHSSHIYNALISGDGNDYVFTCEVIQCNDTFTAPKEDVIGSYVTSNTDSRLGNSQTPLAYGIDVSKWQGPITQEQWNAIANTQIDGHTITFAILRIGTGDRSDEGVLSRHKDETFENNYTRAKAAGLQVGCYFYTMSYTQQEAIADAEQVIEWIGDKQFEYPIFFDIESEYIANANNINNTDRTEMCTAFINKMREEGFFTGFYTYDSWMNNYLNSSSLLPEYDFWYARYYDNTPNDWQSSWAGAGRKFGMWQYTDQKSIAPISGNVDCNVAYKNYPLIIKSLHLNNF